MLLVGKFDSAVDLCLRTGDFSDALMIAIAGGCEKNKKRKKKEEEEKQTNEKGEENKKRVFMTMCLSSRNYTEQLFFCFSLFFFFVFDDGRPELLARTQQAYFAQRKTRLASLLQVVVSQDWTTLVQTSSIDQWTDTLAMLLTYARPHDLPGLLDLLAQRLAQQPGRDTYLCATPKQKKKEKQEKKKREEDEEEILFICCLPTGWRRLCATFVLAMCSTLCARGWPS